MMDLITLPTALSRPTVLHAPDERLSAENKENPRILIVEDDYVVGVESENALADAGFVVVGIANSAQEAVQLAISERPMLAVMDIRLAGQRDGVDAALEMLKACGIRCVFATAHHDAETRARAEKAAPLGWLSKPYQLDSLISMVAAALAELKKGRS